MHSLRSDFSAISHNVENVSITCHKNVRSYDLRCSILVELGMVSNRHTTLYNHFQPQQGRPLGSHITINVAGFLTDNGDIIFQCLKI